MLDQPLGETRAVKRQLLTLKALFIPLLTHPKIAQVIKYTVYAGLAINTVFYVADDYGAMLSTQPEDASLGDLLTTFATSIDMFAWLGLIALFELETYALPDEAFTRRITRLLRVGRALCYVSIIYAAYGYTVEAMDTYVVTLVEGVSDLCQVAGQGASVQVDVIHYTEVVAANCASLTADTRFYTLDGEVALVPESMLSHIRLMGWLDISNAYVWLLVVALIEAEVWLQTEDRFASTWLLVVRSIKTLGYLVLIGNAITWGLHDYYLYAWDSFLWIFGFWAIEFNLAYWEQERLKELAAEGASIDAAAADA
ncbi:MAG: hypothetical protein QNI86_09050 [Halieaceae bacterium]|nr:hypothetical protein [Halieaceae bacterium]